MANSRIKFEDYSDEVIATFKGLIIEWLYEVIGEFKSQVQRNTRVDTGQLKSSWDTDVDENNYVAQVGSPLQNAIWEEFGTGQYAINGNGRKTSWAYKDRNGDWHKTVGKRPSRALENARAKVEPKIQTALENKLRKLN